MNSIRVIFLGPARTVAGRESMDVSLPDPPTVAALRAHLSEVFPVMRLALPSWRIAINMSYADDAAPLAVGDEAAIIPPVSGGSGGERVWVELFRGPLPNEHVRRFVSGVGAIGGIVIFEGATRAEHDDEHGALVRLDYEAYDDMALCEMRKLAETALHRWPVKKVVLLHRLGAVPVSETSVTIAVAAGHRGEAFDACRWLIDTLKQDVPIWKKDIFADGYERWVDPKR